MYLLWCCFLSFLSAADARERFKPRFPQSGPWQEATRGRIWPQPALAEYEDNRTVIVDRERFEFKVCHCSLCTCYDIQYLLNIVNLTIYSVK